MFRDRVFYEDATDDPSEGKHHQGAERAGEAGRQGGGA
jgi:hypothetical protein